MRKAIETYLEDQTDIQTAYEALKEFHADNFKTYSLDQIKKENGL